MIGSIGIDEVGRGPLAGPVTVCACFIQDEDLVLEHIFGHTIRDSKKLTKHNRNNIYKTIRKNRIIKSSIKYAVSSRSAAYIDAYGIVPAVNACIASCIRSLRAKGVRIEKCVIRLDAGLQVREENLNQQSFVKGDERFVEIALASVIAKVTRDRYMEKLATIHTGYGWDRNVGYGTQEHRKGITKHGISKHHRTSFLKAFKQFDKSK